MMKFQIEYIAKDNRPVYLIARQLEPGNFIVSEKSRLGGAGIKPFVSQPRALKKDGTPDSMIFTFFLASANDLSLMDVGKIVELTEGHCHVTDLQDWDEQLFGSLSFETVKVRHQPDYKFRIQQHKYGPHTPYPERTSVASAFYVLSGWVQVTSEVTSEVWKVNAGQVLRRQKDDFIISHPEGVDIIKVFELPRAVWPKEFRNADY